ncbi:MAG: AMP-binding protein [Motiliproteus sp.]
MSGNLYTRLVSHALFPLHEKIKGHRSTALRKALEQSQWLPATEIRRLQNQKLQAFIRNIYANVPYYHDLFDSLALRPEHIETVTDLSRLPFLTKAVIRAHETALKATANTQLKAFNTGGSSGAPLIFYLDHERISHDVAAKWRATRWWDVDIGDSEIVAWGSPIELGGQDRIKLARDALFRSTLIPAFDMSETHLQAFIDKIRHSRPKMLFGYPSVFDLIARRAEVLGIRLDNLGIKVAFVTSERLYDHQRERIESAFGCPVANGYGGRDAGFIAHQCLAGSMHISAEDIIVEIIDPDGTPLPAGQSGEIVTTHLATSGFPFVRYRTGDIGTLSADSCACGRGLPVLEKIEGRATDFVVAKDGTIMHGLALIYVLRELPGIEEFRIVQESLEHTRVEIVPSLKPLSAEIGNAVESGMKRRLGETVKISVEEVEAVQAEKSGKFRYVQSKVSV